MRGTSVDIGLDKLQDFLLAMAPGDEVSARHAAEISGLDHKRCDAILDALMRAGLMMRLQQDAYVRCRLETNQKQSA
jgi:hypothetical protein